MIHQDPVHQEGPREISSCLPVLLTVIARSSPSVVESLLDEPLKPEVDALSNVSIATSYICVHDQGYKFVLLCYLLQ